MDYDRMGFSPEQRQRAWAVEQAIGVHQAGPSLTALNEVADGILEYVQDPKDAATEESTAPDRHPDFNPVVWLDSRSPSTEDLEGIVEAQLSATGMMRSRAESKNLAHDLVRSLLTEHRVIRR